MDTRVALITGGNNGIGKAIAEELAQAGIGNLVLVGRNKKTLDQAQTELQEKYGTKTQTIAADLTLPSTYTTIAEVIEQTYEGKLDILVNNAGVLDIIPAKGREAPDQIYTDILKDITIDAAAAIAVSRNLRPYLLAAQNPVQLDILSSAAVEPFDGNLGYGPAKLAQLWASLITAKETEGKIKLLRLYPSNVDTDMNPFDVDKMSRSSVAAQAARMILHGNPTDHYMGLINGQLIQASFTIDYTAFKGKNADAYDGLALKDAVFRGHLDVFSPAIQKAKNNSLSRSD